MDTGIQIWNANEVNGIEFPVKTQLLPFLPLEPNITTTEPETTTTAAIETVCTELCEGLADGTFISDGCCSPTFCICPYPVEQSCNEDDISYKQDIKETTDHTRIPTLPEHCDTDAFCDGYDQVCNANYDNCFYRGDSFLGDCAAVNGCCKGIYPIIKCPTLGNNLSTEIKLKLFFNNLTWLYFLSFFL